MDVTDVTYIVRIEIRHTDIGTYFHRGPFSTREQAELWAATWERNNPQHKVSVFGMKVAADAPTAAPNSCKSQEMPRHKPINAIADPVGFARQSDPRKARAMQARRDNVVSQRDAARTDTRLMRFSFGGPPPTRAEDRDAPPENPNPAKDALSDIEKMLESILPFKVSLGAQTPEFWVSAYKGYKTFQKIAEDLTKPKRYD